MDVHVSFCLTSGLPEHRINAALDLLSADERARHRRFLRADNRRDFAAAHALLRTALSAHSTVRPHQWRFQVGTHGKPSIDSRDEGARLSFNLAHTDGLVACIVTRDADVGIDVESIGGVRDELAIARSNFSHREIRNLERCAPEVRCVRFTETWTLKEAYLKTTGAGLSHALDSFAFSFDEPGVIAFQAAAAPGPVAWRFALFAPTTAHRLAVALRGGEPQAILRLTRCDAPDDPGTAVDTATLQLASSDGGFTAAS